MFKTVKPSSRRSMQLLLFALCLCVLANLVLAAPFGSNAASEWFNHPAHEQSHGIDFDKVAFVFAVLALMAAVIHFDHIFPRHLALRMLSASPLLPPPK